MSIYQKIRGTIETIFQLGLDGPNLKNNSGVIEGRNSADSDYAIMRGATPVGDQDLVTKLYADTLEKPLIVGRQADCSVSLPSNTGTRGFVVVTTAGSGAAIGDVLYDDGSGTGTMSILAAVEGRTIAVTDTLSGGTVTFEADTINMWDADGSQWLKVGDVGSVSGAVRTIQYTIDNTPSQDSTSQLPAGVQVLEARVEVTTPYSAGATIDVGTTATADAFMANTANLPQQSATYICDQDTAVASASVVRTAVGGTPAAGAGIVTVFYSNPNA